MKKAYSKALKKRELFKKYEIKKQTLLVGMRLQKNLKIYGILKFQDLPKNSFIGSIRKKCFVSGRSRSVFKFLKISRIKFREFCLGGFACGFKVSRW